MSYLYIHKPWTRDMKKKAAGSRDERFQPFIRGDEWLDTDGICFFHV